MINKQRLVTLTRDLIKINSENPPGNEYKIARFIEKTLKNIGLTTLLYEFTKGRPNVIGILQGDDIHKSLLLTPHVDTVPAGKGWKYPPFAAKIEKGRIYGRGATDCKGNVAAGIEALTSLKEDGVSLRHTLLFAATVDEETGSKFGLLPLIEEKILKPSAAVILDSDVFNIIVAQKGLIHFKISISGKKAHGAYPERGINAIECATKIITKLKNYKFRYKKHPLLKSPTINIGTIRGGDKVNMVADWCEVEVDLRFLPGMNGQEILRQIRALIATVTKQFKITVHDMQIPCEVDIHHPLVKCLKDTNKRIVGSPRLKGSEGATVLTFFAAANIPSVATGFGTPKCAHTTDEYVRINDLYKGARVLEAFIKEYDKQ
ncbi:M20 family metallopeptidase [Candidatus Omnitrophota bacterium]